MSDAEKVILPPLPTPSLVVCGEQAFTRRQMQQFARAALSAARPDEWQPIEIYGIGTEGSPLPAIWYTDKETAEWKAQEDVRITGARVFIRTAKAVPAAISAQPRKAPRDDE